MGAAFAIQVMTGKEKNVKKLMEWAFSKCENAQNWVKAIHNVTESTVRVLSEGGVGKVRERAIMPGYIFLEMNYDVDQHNQSAAIPADVWHLIKSIPGVLKQFTSSGQVISADEFQQMLGLEPEEQVEVIVSTDESSVVETEATQVSEVEGVVQNALHQVNTAKTVEERVEAEKVLESAEKELEGMIEKSYEEPVGATAIELRQIQKSATESSEKGIIASIKVMIKNGKERICFPKTLLEKIISCNISECKSSPNNVFKSLMKYVRQKIGIS